MPKGIFKRTPEMYSTRKGKPSWAKGKHWKIKDTSNYTGVNGFKKGHKTNLGKPRLESTKNKLRIAHLGKKASEETRKKMSEAQIGNKNHRWLGGISFLPYSVDWTDTLKRGIRERDKYTCQLCKKQSEVLPIHHIDYDKTNCNPNNLITLCIDCHGKTNFDRNYWTNYFKTI